jgi:PEP-CTERM motif
MSIKSLSIVAAAAMAFCAGAAQAQVSGLLNSGFEIAANGPGEFADGWQTLNGATRTDAAAHSGSFSAFLTITNGQPGDQGFFQNSIDHGGLMAVDAANWGTAPVLSFWLKGNTSETGNVNYALRYLDAGGGILNQGDFGAKVVMVGNSNQDWFQVTRSPDTVIPVNTAAVFLEMKVAAGPSGTFPGCGGVGSFCNWGTPAVYVDDISLTLANPPIPEPGTYALMLAGLVGVGAIIRRRRAI